MKITITIKDTLMESCFNYTYDLTILGSLNNNHAPLKAFSSDGKRKQLVRNFGSNNSEIDFMLLKFDDR